MGTNCNIYLPADVKADNVFDIIQKIMGVEFIQTNFPDEKKKKVFDGNLPISNNNQWHLEVTKQYKDSNVIELKDINYLTFSFKDVVNNSYYCLYHTQDDSASDKLEPGAKLLNPGHGAIWCLIGKKLVDFFGGKMMYSDSRDEDDLDNWYMNADGKFARDKYTNELNDKWNLFHNLLFKESRITSQELMEMQCYAAWYNREENLYQSLKKLELFESLDKIPEKNKTTMKLKI